MTAGDKAAAIAEPRPGDLWRSVRLWIKVDRVGVVSMDVSKRRVRYRDWHEREETAVMFRKWAATADLVERGKP